MSLIEMRHLLMAIDLLNQAMQSIMMVRGEVARIESDTIEMAIQNLTREAEKALTNHG